LTKDDYLNELEAIG
jgi:hypothetical protein